MAWTKGRSPKGLGNSRAKPAFLRRKTKNVQALRRVSPMAGPYLSDLIEGEIIPRLLMAHSSAKPPATTPPGAAIMPAEAERFAATVLSGGTRAMLAEIDAMLARGVSVESIFLDLLAPSARKLGKSWEDDACDFVDVTIGLARLHEVLREVALRTPGFIAHAAGPRSALFAPMPGDQHNFGTLMITEMFTRNGWQAEALVCPTQKELLAALGEQAFDLVGLTISNDCHSDNIAALITAMRSVSKNSQIRVLVGGRMVNANPSVAARAGADGTAIDGQAALMLADQLVVGAQELMLS